MGSGRADEIAFGGAENGTAGAAVLEGSAKSADEDSVVPLPLPEAETEPAAEPAADEPEVDDSS